MGRTPDCVAGVLTAFAAVPDVLARGGQHFADNACRYTEPGGRIGVGSRVEHGWLRFWITDSGRGVSHEDRSRIFERFARGGAGGRQSDGAGLGLAIVRAIAVAHGGDVLLDTVPWRGSTFSVVIPVARDGREPWRTS